MFSIAITAQVLLLLYHQITTLVDFYPFNNVRPYTIKERLLECGVNGVLMTLPPVGFALHIKWAMNASLLVYPALLLGEYLNWWHPYLFSPTKTWSNTYQRLFRHTIIVLPPIRNNPVPNLEHCILHGITLITTVCTYIYFFSA